MVYLLLAVSCSLAIGMIFKVAGRRQMDRTALLTANYAAAVGVAGVLLATGVRAGTQGLQLAPALVGLGLATGALLIFGFYILSLATDVAGMSLAIGVMRVSVVIPFLMSWIVWDETPTLAQGIGLVLASIAFFLIADRRASVPDADPEWATAAAVASEPSAAPDWQEEAPAAVPEAEGASSGRTFAVLAVLFLSGGAVDVTMKAFEENFGAQNSRVLFLLMAFGVAFLIGLVILLWRGRQRGIWPARATIGWGVLLGVINYGSLEFILRAIERLPGTFVFPVNNIAIVVLAAVLGVVVWGERLSRANRIGLGLAVFALLLLNL